MDTIEKSGKKQVDATEDYERQLIHRGIKPTAVRLLVVRALANAECALSLTDLEGRIGTVDKSSIFRTLALFLQHHLIHDVEDGTGQVKYALCAERCHCGEDVHAGLTDLHTHFYCEKCTVPSVSAVCPFRKWSFPKASTSIRPTMCSKAFVRSVCGRPTIVVSVYIL